jgi:hypothetical protein
MKGIYLTEEGKKAIEDRVAELEEHLKEEANPFIYTDVSAELNTYKRILCYATVLPIEKSWGRIIFNGEDEVKAENSYPNGVIIQLKSTTNAEV